jgi:flagellar L-ring protein FlgH
MTMTLFARLLLISVAAVALNGCAAVDRIAGIGAPPAHTPIENPTKAAGYQPVSLPMPAPESASRHANSLWRPGARAFFKDQRAARVGDILTINIAIADEAKVDNTTTRSRTNTEKADATNFLGLELELAKKLPQGVDPTKLIGFGSSNSSEGKGSVDRKETVNLKVAAIVTQVLPNGNMVVHGRQEVRVNFERRDLEVTGVVRPEDIAAANTINHTQIAEARITYGGKGQITDVQQPRYGQQLFDVVFPF